MEVGITNVTRQLPLPAVTPKMEFIWPKVNHLKYTVCRAYINNWCAVCSNMKQQLKEDTRKNNWLKMKTDVEGRIQRGDNSRRSQMVPEMCFANFCPVSGDGDGT